MNFSYRLTADEFIEGLTKLSSKNRMVYRLVYGMLIAFLAMELINLFVDRSTIFIPEALIIFFPFFLLLLAFIFAFKVILPYVFKKQLKNNKMYSEEVNLKLSEEGVYINHAMGDSFLKWSAFSHYSYNEKCCALFTTPNCLHIIPRRIFDEKGFIEFENFVSKHLKKL